jgi:hypothetical protein
VPLLAVWPGTLRQARSSEQAIAVARRGETTDTTSDTSDTGVRLLYPSGLTEVSGERTPLSLVGASRVIAPNHAAAIRLLEHAEGRSARVDRGAGDERGRASFVVLVGGFGGAEPIRVAA